MFQLYPYKSGSGSPTYRCEIFSVIVSMAHAMAHLRPHVVLLPSLGFGHLMPLLELSNRLAARGFTVSLVLTPHHAPFAHTKLPKTASDIRILELDVDVNLHRNSNANVNAVAPTVALSQTLLRTPFENLLERMFREGVDGLPPPLCIISDFFLAWTVEVAARFGIPRINVECSPPHAMNLVELLWTRLPRNFERTASGRYIVPGGGDNPTILSASEMSPGLPEADERHPKHLLYKRVFPINQQGSWATVSNTFEELEKIHIGHFQSRYVGPVRAVGPLLPSAGGGRRCSESDWLDGRSAGSVVYVSFGSENSVSSGEMYELALGLELSGKPFLWVLRLPSDVASGAPTEFLPEGFCSRTERRGRIVTGWTDQFAVLSHPAVGGFVTHCGWNSLLEGISCGVPFICWPLSAEQPFNAKFIVEEAKCGVRVPKAADRDEIQRVICSVLDEDESVKGVKRNAMKWKEMAKAAVSEGGSSARNFDGLVDDILSLQKQGNGSAQHFP